MLDVTAHSQRGRVCEYRRSDASVVTPYVMKVTDCNDPFHITADNGKRTLHVMDVSIPLDDGLLTSESSDVYTEPVLKDGVCVIRLPFNGEIPEGTEVLVIANGYELRDDARKLVKTVIDIREKAGYNVLICAPGLADASNLALLAYMGIDVFDDSVARAFGINKIMSMPEGLSVCDEDVTEYNVSAMEEECRKVKLFIEGGRLRELVDQREFSSPISVATLRIFDDEGYAYQEEACSTVGCRFACNTVQALRRPDVLRYRRMILERYHKPAHKRILLLLPCSAKKPYHISKTHKRFASAIHTASHDTLVHEVIITSPLGIVPRELDTFYPANSYDIPVTGEWKPEEKQFIRDMLSHLLEQGYDKVISHLGEDTDLIRGLCEMEETVVGDPTSPASLTKLDETLRAAAKGIKCGNYGEDRRETVRSVLGFQFGNDVAEAIMENGTICIGKFPYWKIIRDNVQLGMMTAERGMISLTLDGAKILASMNRNVVEMMDFELKGNLFAVGVVKADPSIRIGDEAVIVLNGVVKGVGVAMMSGREMTELSRGIAVRIRHKSK
jgi:archaeosine synthase alpha-subunit